MESERSGLIRAFDLAFAIDRSAEQAYVRDLRERYPERSREQLIAHITQRARYWGAGIGFATGVGSNPWAALPAALADVTAVLRAELTLACRIALLYDPQYLDDPEPPYELLIPILGTRAASELAGRAVIVGGREMTQKMLRDLLARDGVARLRKWMFTHLGIRVTKRGLASKLVPVIGGIIGGTWNYIEVSIVAGRVSRYLEGKTIKV